MDEHAIYQTALTKRDAAEREAYLAEACGDNTWLRQHLAARINSEFRSGLPAAQAKLALVDNAELKRWLADLEKNPNDIELTRRCGFGLAGHSRFEEAVDCWLRVEDAFPDDSEASAMVTQLTIEKSRQADGVRKPSKKGAATSATPAPVANKPTTATVSGSLVDRNIELTPIQQLELAHRNCPSLVEVYSQLVPLYLEKGREYDAERLLAKGKEATDNDPTVLQLWEDVRLLRMEKVVAVARKQAQVPHPSAEVQAALNDALTKQDRLELEISEARAKRSPNDAHAARQLGSRLLKKGRATDARPYLEAALQDPVECSAAALSLGDCFRDLDNLPEALKYYGMAVEAAQQQHQVPLEEQALLQSGKLALEMKLPKVAQQYLSQLLEKDPHHQEAAALLDALAAG